jgi:hypothetical protein
MSQFQPSLIYIIIISKTHFNIILSYSSPQKNLYKCLIFPIQTTDQANLLFHLSNNNETCTYHKTNVPEIYFILYRPHIRRKFLLGMLYMRMCKISPWVNKQQAFMCSDEFNVNQCRILSQHPQYTVKVHSLHATLNCLMFSVCL